MLIGLLAFAGLAAVVINEDRTGDSPAPQVIPSSTVSPSSLAARLRVGSDLAFRLEEETDDFVVEVELTNGNQVPVRVKVADAPEATGFLRLAAAVMLPADRMPQFAAVAAAADTPVTLAPNADAHLTIAGRVACGSPRATGNTMELLVNSDRRTMTLPSPEPSGSWGVLVDGLC